MNDFTICITTFSKRYDLLESLINQIRKFTDRKILISINGEKNGEFINEYRLKMLNLCSLFNDIYPVFFIETRGLSKMWNTLLSHSENHHVMILNDDIIINSNDIFEKTFAHINSTDFSGITLLNSSFSHFVTDRRFIDNLGYFDERLLGFGEEDGDIIYRIYKTGQKHSVLWVSGLINIISDTRHEHVEKGSINNREHKYSKFNREFIYQKKYKENKNSQMKGMFDSPMDQELNDYKVYPYENFFWENKNKL